MGDVVTFGPKPPAGYERDETGAHVIMDVVANVGAILVLATCAAGAEEDGPYRIVLRTSGTPDCTALTLSRNVTTCDAQQFLDAVRDHATAVTTALRFADANAHRLPSFLPPDPVPA